MRVNLRGINSTRKVLKDGTARTYYYAWKGGPKLPGKPGDPEFVAAYNRAIATKVTPPAGLLIGVITKFLHTEEFLALAPRTQADYKQIVDTKIAPAFGDLPTAALSESTRECRGEFKQWRDEIAGTSRRRADYAWSVLARILSVALDRGWVNANPCERGGRLYRGSRRDNIWSAADEQNFLELAPAHLHLPLMLALWTGQRQGDLLKLTWASYDGSCIRLRQGKTGARVCVPVGAPLKALLDIEKRRGLLILLTSEGKPWAAAGFSSSWRKACKRAGVAGVTFQDLRGTAVTRLAVAGATEAEIAAITGHSLKATRSILDIHYLHRDPELAAAAIRKLEVSTEQGQKRPTRRPTGSSSDA